MPLALQDAACGDACGGGRERAFLGGVGGQGLTEQVIPGHIGLFLHLHWLENEYPVMVEVF